MTHESTTVIDPSIAYRRTTERMPAIGPFGERRTLGRGGTPSLFVSRGTTLMKHLRTGSVGLLVVAAMCILSATPALAATAPGATLSLNANPASVAQGGTVVLSGTVTNTAKTSEKVTITYAGTGPCNYAETQTVSLTLQVGESRSASLSWTAPACAGTYTVTGTVRAGTTVLATASTTATVQ
jgi:hypothetical protein